MALYLPSLSNDEPCVLPCHNQPQFLTSCVLFLTVLTVESLFFACAERCFLFQILTSATFGNWLGDFKFFPYASSEHFYLQDFSFEEESFDFWICVLTPIDLLLRLLKKGRFYHEFKVYSPKYCARQFSLTQVMPMPIQYYFEFPFVNKKKYKLSESGPFDCRFEIPI